MSGEPPVSTSETLPRTSGALPSFRSSDSLPVREPTTSANRKFYHYYYLSSHFILLLILLIGPLYYSRGYCPLNPLPSIYTFPPARSFPILFSLDFLSGAAVGYVVVVLYIHFGFPVRLRRPSPLPTLPQTSDYRKYPLVVISG